MNVTYATERKLYTSVTCELNYLHEGTEIELPYITLDQEPPEIFTLEFCVLRSKPSDKDESTYFTLTLTFENYVHEMTHNYGYEILGKIKTTGNDFIPLFSCEKMRTAKSISITDKLTIIDFVSIKCSCIYFDIRRYKVSKEDESNDLCENFNQVLNSKSDINIVVGDHKFYAHKNILSNKSIVFKQMCTADMTESLTGIIKIDDFAPAVIEEMLQYIYTGKSKNLSKMSKQLFKAAHKYDLVNLQAICKEYFIFDMNIENVVSLLDLANIYEFEDLKNGAMTIIENNEEEMSKIKAYQKFMCRNLNTSTIVYTLNLSFKYNMEFVKSYLIKYIKEHQKELAENSEFLKLFESQPKLMQEIFVSINK